MAQALSVDKESNSDQQYRALMRQCSDPIFVVQDEQIAFVNDAWQHAFGYDLETVRGENFDYVHQVVAPASRSSVATCFSPQADEEQSTKSERWLQARTRDRRLLNLHLTATPITWCGQPATQALCEVLTEHSEVQRALYDSKERWRSLVDAHPDAILIIEGPQIIYANEATADLLGASHPGGVIGRDVRDFVALTDQQQLMQRYERVEQGETLPPALYHLQGLDQEARVAEVYAQLVRYEGRSVHQLIVRDVTEQRQREHDHRERTRRLHHQQNALARLTKRQASNTGNLEAAFAEITETLVHTIDVAHASIWLHEQSQFVFRCHDRYDHDKDEHTCGKTRKAPRHVDFIQRIETGRALTFEEAQSDTLLHSFLPYLQKENITSLISAPIYLEGELAGILSIEHCGSPRSWLPDEQSFANSMADLIALNLESKRRHRTEQALRNSRARYRRVTDNIDEVLFRTDREGRWTFLNPAWSACTGYAVEECLGQYFYEYLPVEDRKKELEIYRTHIRGRTQHFRNALRIRTKGGDVLWMEVEARILRDESGRFVGATGTLRNITERKETEKALRASEQRYRNLADTIDEVLFRTDAEGHWTFLNAAWEDIVGFSREESLGEFFLAHVHPDDYERELQKYRRLFQSDISHFQNHLRIRRKDGTIRWVEVQSRILRDEEGRIQKTIGTFLDITERKEAEQALRDNQALLSSINENVTEAIYRSKKEGGLVYVNQAFTQMFGFDSTEEALEADSPSLYAHPAERNNHDKELVGQGTMRNVEVEFRRRDGSTFWGLLNTRAITDENGKAVYWDGAITDITDRKEREQALVAAKEEAEQMNRLKSTFLANMSHEIRTPLTSIIGFADVLAGELEDDNKRELINLIRQSGDRLMQTLNSVLHLSQLEGGSLDMNLRPLDVPTVLREAIPPFRMQAREKNLVLSVKKSSPTEKLWARLDEDAFHRVLANLLSNAIKFTEEGGVTVRLQTIENAIRISVEDTGIGISPSFQEELFEEFRQESSGLSREHEGSGLGLAITQRLIKRMGGDLTVDSEKGRGSTFTVEVPRLNEKDLDRASY